jgi:hypothetical protein
MWVLRRDRERLIALGELQARAEGFPRVPNWKTVHELLERAEPAWKAELEEKLEASDGE